MKKIYILYNTDFNEVIATSEDKSLLEEIMCDNFFEDLICEFYYHTNVSAQEVWLDVLDWYLNFMEIFESEVI